MSSYRCMLRPTWMFNIKMIIIIKSIIKRDLIIVLSNCQGPIKDTKRTRGRPDRNVAPCSRPITTVIGPLHECKKVCPCTKALPPSGSRAWIKQGRRKRKKRGRETGKTEARRLMKRKAAQQNKNTSEELKQGLPRHRLRLTKKGGGGGAPNF